jgi:RimJ/RimL family protein N-acetyltransferase
MQSVGIYRLETDHAAALAQLLQGEGADDGGIASDLEQLGAGAFLAARIAGRDAGAGHAFAISDRGKLLGLCELRELVQDRAVVDVWIAGPFRRRGHGSLGIRMMLEFAFVNLRLAAVEAKPRDAAARALLEKNGFRHDGDPRRWTIDPDRWRSHRDAPALARLTSSLRTLLDAELAAGNEIVETGTGWPDADSVFVRLRLPFRARPASLPAGVSYLELNDPHWWRAEYNTAKPRHLLVH